MRGDFDWKVKQIISVKIDTYKTVLSIHTFITRYQKKISVLSGAHPFQRK